MNQWICLLCVETQVSCNHLHMIWVQKSGSSSLFFVLFPWLSHFYATFHLPRSLLPVPHWSKLTQHFHPGLYECAQVIIDSDGGRGGHYRIKGDKPQRWKKDEEENKRKKNETGITGDSQDLGYLPRTISSWISGSEVAAHRVGEKSWKLQGEYIIFLHLIPFYSLASQWRQN